MNTQTPDPYCLRAWHVFVVGQRNWQLWAYFLRTQVKFEERT